MSVKSWLLFDRVKTAGKLSLSAYIALKAFKILHMFQAD